MAASPRAAFVLVLREHRRIGRRFKTMYDGKDPLSVEWLAVLEQALGPHAHRHRRRPPGWLTLHARAVLGDDQYDALRAPFEKRATELYDDLWSRRRLLEKVLDSLANRAAVHVGGEPRVLAVVWESTYNTQGYCAHRYAQAAAENHADVARHHGVPVEVREVVNKVPLLSRVGSAEYTDFKVMVTLRTELDVEILRHRTGPTLREWLRLCWKRGVNPRVYNPWLPVGLEDKLGLDYFGGEVRHG